MGFLKKLLGGKEKPVDTVNYHLGPYKKIVDITVDDFKLHPVWVTGKGGEGFGFDSDTPRPVLGVKRVSEPMLAQFKRIYVFIKFTDTGHWGWAAMSETFELDSIVVWTLYNKEDGRKVFAGQSDIPIQVIPQLLGRDSQEYLYNPETGKALERS